MLRTPPLARPCPLMKAALLGGGIKPAWWGKGREQGEAQKERSPRELWQCPLPRIKGSRTKRRDCSELQAELRRLVRGAPVTVHIVWTLVSMKKFPPEPSAAYLSALSPRTVGGGSGRSIHGPHEAVPSKGQG